MTTLFQKEPIKPKVEVKTEVKPDIKNLRRPIKQEEELYRTLVIDDDTDENTPIEFPLLPKNC